MKILYTSDLHGSDLVFNKFLSHAINNSVDVVIIGGDLSGKTMTPIIKHNHRNYSTSFHEKQVSFGESQLHDYRRRISNSGSYPVVFLENEYKISEDEFENILNREIEIRLRKWLARANDLLTPRGIKIFIICGNDDSWVLDEVFRDFPNIINPDIEPMIYKNFLFLGESTTNISPFNCPRDVSEDIIESRLKRKLRKAESREYNDIIFIAHCPPHESGLDVAYKISDGKLVLNGGQPISVNVGSKTIKNFIMDYKPIVSLHGHIHESYGDRKIGETHAFNPGSEYFRGTFRGYLISLDNGKIYSHIINA